MDGIRILFVLGLAAAAGALVGGCSSPSERFGLPPVSAIQGDYPNINLDPAQRQADPNLTPEQKAEAEAQLLKRAGKKPEPAAAN